LGLQGTWKAKKEADAKPAAAPMDPGFFMVKLGRLLATIRIKLVHGILGMEMFLRALAWPQCGLGRSH